MKLGAYACLSCSIRMTFVAAISISAVTATIRHDTGRYVAHNR